MGKSLSCHGNPYVVDPGNISDLEVFGGHEANVHAREKFRSKLSVSKYLGKQMYGSFMNFVYAETSLEVSLLGTGTYASMSARLNVVASRKDVCEVRHDGPVGLKIPDMHFGIRHGSHDLLKYRLASHGVSHRGTMSRNSEICCLTSLGSSPYLVCSVLLFCKCSRLAAA